MHLVFNNFLNQIRKSSTGNFTVVKSEETIVIITFADLCIVFSFLMYCIQKFINSFYKLFAKCILYARHCPEYLEYKSQQNKNAWPHGAYMCNTYFKGL